MEKITKLTEGFLVQTIDRDSQTESYRAKFIINAAGHYADVLAAMIQDKDFTLKARRGQYRVIEKTERGIINNHILFMVPTIHGKGVIVAPMLDDHLLVGPTAEEGIAKEDTRLIRTQTELVAKVDFVRGPSTSNGDVDDSSNSEY